MIKGCYAISPTNCLEKTVCCTIGLISITAIALSIIGLTASYHGPFHSIVKIGPRSHKILLASFSTTLILDLVWLRFLCVNQQSQETQLDAVQINDSQIAGKKEDLMDQIKGDSLYEAAKSGKLEIVRKLIDKGDITAFYKGCAVIEAAAQGNEEIVGLLLTNGTITNDCADWRSRGIIEACKGKYYRTAQILWINGTDSDREEILQKIVQGKAMEAIVWIESLKIQQWIEILITYAIQIKSCDILQSLIKTAADKTYAMNVAKDENILIFLSNLNVVPNQ